MPGGGLHQVVLAKYCVRNSTDHFVCKTGITQAHVGELRRGGKRGLMTSDCTLRLGRTLCI